MVWRALSRGTCTGGHRCCHRSATDDFCCAQHLLEALRTAPATPVPDLLNSTFHTVDTKLSELAAADGTHSGCTAVTAFLRLEDEKGNPVGDAAGVGRAVETKEGELQGDAEGALKAAQAGEGTELQRMGRGEQLLTSDDAPAETSSTRDDIKNKIKAVLTGKSPADSRDGSPSGSGTASPTAARASGINTPTAEVKGPAEVKKAAKRTLYTANVGDARAVLS